MIVALTAVEMSLFSEESTELISLMLLTSLVLIVWWYEIDLSLPADRTNCSLHCLGSLAACLASSQICVGGHCLACMVCTGKP